MYLLGKLSNVQKVYSLEDTYRHNEKNIAIENY